MTRFGLQPHHVDSLEFVEVSKCGSTKRKHFWVLSICLIEQQGHVPKTHNAACDQ